jgi:hypothetical protein
MNAPFTVLRGRTAAVFALIVMPLFTRGISAQDPYPGPNNAYPGPFLLEEHIQQGFFPFASGGHRVVVPFFSNRAFTQGGDEVRLLLVVNHGWTYQAKHYLAYALEAAQQEGVLEQVAVVTPNFIGDDDKEPLHGGEPGNMLYWDDWPFWGHAGGRIREPPTTLNVGVFEVLDALLGEAVSSGRFPHLQGIVIWGFSAGGQLVNRYSAFNRFQEEVAEPAGLRVRYVVAAAATYLYHSQHRLSRGTQHFELLAKEDYIDCAEADQYGLGTEGLFPHPASIGWESVRRSFPGRNVVYLVGADDIDPEHAGLTRTCGAQRQGATRVERALVYLQYLRFFYGERITRTQAVHLLSDADHSSRSVLLSPLNRYLMLMRDEPFLWRMSSRD